MYTVRKFGVDLLRHSQNVVNEPGAPNSTIMYKCHLITHTCILRVPFVHACTTHTTWLSTFNHYCKLHISSNTCNTSLQHRRFGQHYTVHIFVQECYVMTHVLNRIHSRGNVSGALAGLKVVLGYISGGRFNSLIMASWNPYTSNYKVDCVTTIELRCDTYLYI